MVLAIKIENLTYSHPDSTKAFDNLSSVQIPVGKKVALLGPNRAGKSTLLHHLNGLKVPQERAIEVIGIPPQKRSDK